MDYVAWCSCYSTVKWYWTWHYRKINQLCMHLPVTDHFLHQIYEPHLNPYEMALLIQAIVSCEAVLTTSVSVSVIGLHVNLFSFSSIRLLACSPALWFSECARNCFECWSQNRMCNILFTPLCGIQLTHNSHLIFICEASEGFHVKHEKVSTNLLRSPVQ